MEGPYGVTPKILKCPVYLKFLNLIVQIWFLSVTFGPIKNCSDFVFDKLKNAIGFKIGGTFNESSFDTSGLNLDNQARFSERSKNFD